MARRRQRIADDTGKICQLVAALPDGLHASWIAEVLEAVVELDLTDLLEIELPRGYGRN